MGGNIAALLCSRGERVVLFDDFHNSHPVVLEQLSRITGQAIEYVEGDILDTMLLRRVLCDYAVDAVVHCAGLKSVPQSLSTPERYFSCNAQGTQTVLDAMRETSTRTLVFSSSASVYGDGGMGPLVEEHPLRPTHPYGESKRLAEQAMLDMARKEPNQWRMAILRCFHPVGAHVGGFLDAHLPGAMDHAMPHLIRVATGQVKEFLVYGGDYATPDGTSLRDYLHIEDVARAYAMVLDHVTLQTGVAVLNLGRGTPVSMLQLLRTFETASGCPIPYRIVERRPGDTPVLWSDSSKAWRLLGWRAQHDVLRMCHDAWQWHVHGRAHNRKN